MNVLAHLLLAGDDPGLRVGGFIADFVRGPDLDAFKPDVARGIRLHRRIDAFTDAHPAFRTSVARLRERRGRYAPVLVDVFYDHVLALRWDEFHARTLEEFVSEATALLRRHEATLPERCRRFLDHLIRRERLTAYRTVEGIAATLQEMSTRTRPGAPLPGAEEDLVRHAAGLEEDFRAFFPDALAAVLLSPP
jgi:acyl carrier protein phosphodiesterase